MKKQQEETLCRMSLNRIGVVNQIFSVPTEKGKKVLIMIKEFIEREAAIDHFCVGGKI